MVPEWFEANWHAEQTMNSIRAAFEAKDPNFLNVIRTSLPGLGSEFSQVYDYQSYLAAVQSSVYADIFNEVLEECLVRSEARGPCI